MRAKSLSPSGMKRVGLRPQAVLALRSSLRRRFDAATTSHGRSFLVLFPLPLREEGLGGGCDATLDISQAASPLYRGRSKIAK